MIPSHMVWVQCDLDNNKYEHVNIVVFWYVQCEARTTD